MKRLMIITALIATPAFADGPSPYARPEVIKPVCQYQFLLWKWTGDCRASAHINSDNNGDGVSRPVHSGPNVGGTVGKPNGHPARPKHDPKGRDKVKGNNGLGNGDQPAPGKSLNRNKAENQRGNPGHASGKRQNSN